MPSSENLQLMVMVWSISLNVEEGYEHLKHFIYRDICTTENRKS